MERKDNGKHCSLVQCIGLAECWFINGGPTGSNDVTGQPRTGGKSVIHRSAHMLDI